MSRLHSFLSSCMRTRYEVDVPESGAIALAIGQPNAALDDLLRHYGVDIYAYLTAFNPQSTTLSDDDNRLRHERLCRGLTVSGYAYLTGKAIPDTDAWEPETCVFVPGMSRAVVREVCERYQQDGAVVGELGTAPKLLFTDPRLRDDFRALLHRCVLD